MVTPHTISDLWREKKHILVPSLESHLDADLEQALLTFKQKKIEQKLEAIGYKLRACKDEDDTIILLEEHQRLTSLKQTICLKLHRVVV